MTRLQSYISASSHCKINKPMTDFISFFWEKEKQEETVIDKAEIERLKQEIKQSEDILNGKLKN